MKSRKGFTIIELVVTIGILSVAFGLSTVAFSNLSRIQKSATDQYVANQELDKVDNLVKEYISIVSLDTSSIKFDYEHVENADNYVKFKEKEVDPNYSYSLRYVSSTLSYFSDYSGDNDYLKQHKAEQYKYINDIKFTYSVSLALLTLDIKYNGSKTIRNSYVVRTAL